MTIAKGGENFHISHTVRTLKSNLQEFEEGITFIKSSDNRHYVIYVCYEAKYSCYQDAGRNELLLQSKSRIDKSLATGKTRRF
jgi:hypothetical protein